MVSERHNLAYKETMKLFDRLPVDAPLNRFPLVSYVKGDDVYHGGDHLIPAREPSDDSPVKSRAHLRADRLGSKAK